ncbi:MAG TPA: site-2 protease family protein [Acidimicrobiia bacterium]|nr:site-2 protease family protein [Acidimicrobiia bacterium]
MAPRAWRLARIAGTDIRIDPSWGIIALLVGYSFYFVVDAFFPASSLPVVLAVSIGMTIAFFASLLLHELAHAGLARSRGLEVRGITLFLFGGATEADLDAEKPGDEFWIAVVGPLTSLAIAGALWTLVEFGSSLVGEHIAFAAGRLGWLNLALALFNLLPGFPLDGGRLVRAAVWASTGDLRRSTEIAARTGQAIGFLLIGFGLLELLAGGVAGGLWTAAIGWFLTRAADSERRSLRLRETLSGVTVADVMQKVPDPVSRDTPLGDVVHEHLLRNGAPTVAVRDNGHVAGVVTRESIRDIPRSAWDSRTAGDVLTSLERIPSLEPNTPVMAAIEVLRDADGLVVVLDAGDVVGMVSLERLSEWIERAEAVGLTEG